jgi:hypothetical protein
MSPDTATPRWLVVVYPDRPEVLEKLSRTFQRATWVSVLADRRQGQRRKRQALVGPELRLSDRRATPGDQTQEPTYRLTRRGEGFDVYEATGFAPARCEECGATVMFEMPRSTEPPARLDLHVVHDQEPRPRPRHAVELLLYAPSGRPLVAWRCSARTHVEAS